MTSVAPWALPRVGNATGGTAGCKAGHAALTGQCHASLPQFPYWGKADVKRREQAQKGPNSIHELGCAGDAQPRGGAQGGDAGAGSRRRKQLLLPAGFSTGKPGRGEVGTLPRLSSGPAEPTLQGGADTLSTLPSVASAGPSGAPPSPTQPSRAGCSVRRHALLGVGGELKLVQFCLSGHPAPAPHRPHREGLFPSDASSFSNTNPAPSGDFQAFLWGFGVICL